jgi:hypothetical protein
MFLALSMQESEFRSQNMPLLIDVMNAQQDIFCTLAPESDQFSASIVGAQQVSPEF